MQDSATPSGSGAHPTDDPGVSLRSTPGYPLSPLRGEMHAATTNVPAATDHSSGDRIRSNAESLRYVDPNHDRRRSGRRPASLAAGGLEPDARRLEPAARLAGGRMLRRRARGGAGRHRRHLSLRVDRLDRDDARRRVAARAGDRWSFSIGARSGPFAWRRRRSGCRSTRSWDSSPNIASTAITVGSPGSRERRARRRCGPKRSTASSRWTGPSPGPIARSCYAAWPPSDRKRFGSCSEAAGSTAS
jgi:hypothetical protein